MPRPPSFAPRGPVATYAPPDGDVVRQSFADTVGRVAQQSEQDQRSIAQQKAQVDRGLDVEQNQAARQQAAQAAVDAKSAAKAQVAQQKATLGAENDQKKAQFYSEGRPFYLNSRREIQPKQPDSQWQDIKAGRDAASQTEKDMATARLGAGAAKAAISGVDDQFSIQERQAAQSAKQAGEASRQAKAALKQAQKDSPNDADGIAKLDKAARDTEATRVDAEATHNATTNQRLEWDQNKLGNRGIVKNEYERIGAAKQSIPDLKKGKLSAKTDLMSGPDPVIPADRPGTADTSNEHIITPVAKTGGELKRNEELEASPFTPQTPYTLDSGKSTGSPADDLNSRTEAYNAKVQAHNAQADAINAPVAEIQGELESRYGTPAIIPTPDGQSTLSPALPPEDRQRLNAAIIEAQGKHAKIAGNASALQQEQQQLSAAKQAADSKQAKDMADARSKLPPDVRDALNTNDEGLRQSRDAIAKLGLGPEAQQAAEKDLLAKHQEQHQGIVSDYNAASQKKRQAAFDGMQEIEADHQKGLAGIQASDEPLGGGLDVLKEIDASDTKAMGEKYGLTPEETKAMREDARKVSSPWAPNNFVDKVILDKADKSRVLSDGRIIVNPAKWADADAYKEAVAKSGGTPEAKQKALDALPDLQAKASQQMYDGLSENSTIKGFLDAQPGDVTAKVSALIAEQNRNPNWEAIKAGFGSGFHGMAATATGLLALATGQVDRATKALGSDIMTGVADSLHQSADHWQKVTQADEALGGLSKANMAGRAVGALAQFAPDLAAMEATGGLAEAAAWKAGIGTTAKTGAAYLKEMDAARKAMDLATLTGDAEARTFALKKLANMSGINPSTVDAAAKLAGGGVAGDQAVLDGIKEFGVTPEAVAARAPQMAAEAARRQLGAGYFGAKSLGNTYMEAYDAGVKGGKTEEQARADAIIPALTTAALTYGVFSTGSAKGLTGIFQQQGTTKALLEYSLKQAARDVGEHTAISGVQMGLDSLAHDIVAKFSYKPNQDPSDILEKALKSALTGAAFGGFMRAFHHGAARVAGGKGEGGGPIDVESSPGSPIAPSGGPESPAPESSPPDITSAKTAASDAELAAHQPEVTGDPVADAASEAAPVRAEVLRNIATGTPITDLENGQLAALGMKRTDTGEIKPATGKDALPPAISIENGNPIILQPALDEMAQQFPATRSLIGMSEREARAKFTQGQQKPAPAGATTSNVKDSTPPASSSGNAPATEGASSVGPAQGVVKASPAEAAPAPISVAGKTEATEQPVKPEKVAIKSESDTPVKPQAVQEPSKPTGAPKNPAASPIVAAIAKWHLDKHGVKKTPEAEADGKFGMLLSRALEKKAALFPGGIKFDKGRSVTFNRPGDGAPAFLSVNLDKLSEESRKVGVGSVGKMGNYLNDVLAEEANHSVFTDLYDSDPDFKARFDEVWGKIPDALKKHSADAYFAIKGGGKFPSEFAAKAEFFRQYNANPDYAAKVEQAMADAGIFGKFKALVKKFLDALRKFRKKYPELAESLDALVSQVESIIKRMEAREAEPTFKKAPEAKLESSIARAADVEAGKVAQEGSATGANRAPDVTAQGEAQQPTKFGRAAILDELKAWIDAGPKLEFKQAPPTTLLKDQKLGEKDAPIDKGDAQTPEEAAAQSAKERAELKKIQDDKRHTKETTDPIKSLDPSQVKWSEVKLNSPPALKASNLESIHELQKSLEENDAGGGDGTVSPERLRAQAESLRKWASANGRSITAGQLATTLDRDRKLEGGEEHDVWYDKDSGRALKLTKGERWGLRNDLSKYLDYIAGSNSLFGDDIILEGVVEKDGWPHILTSQPFYKGEMATVPEIDKYFADKGFSKVADNIYKNADGAMAVDARPRNMLKLEDGTIQPIDVHPWLTSPHYKSEPRQLHSPSAFPSAPDAKPFSLGPRREKTTVEDARDRIESFHADETDPDNWPSDIREKWENADDPLRTAIDDGGDFADIYDHLPEALQERPDMRAALAAHQEHAELSAKLYELELRAADMGKDEFWSMFPPETKQKYDTLPDDRTKRVEMRALNAVAAEKMLPEKDQEAWSEVLGSDAYTLSDEWASSDEATALVEKTKEPYIKEVRVRAADTIKQLEQKGYKWDAESGSFDDVRDEQQVLYSPQSDDSDEAVAKRLEAQAGDDEMSQEDLAALDDFYALAASYAEKNQPPAEDAEIAPAPKQTSLKNAAVDKERAERNLPPLQKSMRRSWGTADTIAEDALEVNPRAGKRLLRELRDDPRPTLDWENSLLLMHKVNIRHARMKTAEEVAATPVGSSENVQAKQDYDQFAMDESDMDEIIHRAGSESGRSLNARKMMRDEDVSPEGIMQKYRTEVKFGAPLDAEEEKYCRKVSADMQNAIREQDRLENEERDKRLREESKRGLQTIPPKMAKRKRGPIRDAAKAIMDRVKAAKERMAAKRAGTKLNSPSSESMDAGNLADLAEIGMGYIEDGAETLEAFTKALTGDYGDDYTPNAEDIFKASKKAHATAISEYEASQRPQGIIKNAKAKLGEDAPGALNQKLLTSLVESYIKQGITDEPEMVTKITADIQDIYPGTTESDVRTIFRGYGKTAEPSKDDLKMKVAEAKRNIGLLESLDRIGKGLTPLKTGFRPAPLSQKSRSLTEQVSSAMRRAGIKTTGPEQLADSRKRIVTQLTNSIEDLDAIIKGTAKPKTPREVIKYDAEMTALKKHRDEMQAYVDDLTGPSPELKWNREAQAAAKASEEYYRRRIAAKDVESKKSTPQNESPETIATKADAKKAKQDWENLREQSGIPQKEALAKIESDIANEIDAIAAGRAPEVKPAKQQSPAEIQAAKDRLTNLKKLRRLIEGEFSNAPKRIERSIVAAKKTNEELRRRVAEKDISAKSKSPPVPDTPELEALKDERAFLNKILADLHEAAHPRRLPEEIALANFKRKMEKQEREANSKIKRKEYLEPPPVDPVNQKRRDAASFELNRLKADLAQRIFDAKMANRPALEKAWGKVADVLNAQRAIMTSIDLSAVLRQGGWLVAGHPVMAAMSIMPMLRALVSEKASHAAMKELKRRKNYPLYAQAKLYLSDVNELNLSKMEEQYMTRWVKDIVGAKGAAAGAVLGGIAGTMAGSIGAIPGAAIGAAIGASGWTEGAQRAFITFLNKLRADSFDLIMESLAPDGRLTKDQGRALANYINVSTGRGHIGFSKSNPDTNRVVDPTSTPILSSVFFSPRLTASRFNMIFGQPIFGAHARQILMNEGKPEYRRFQRVMGKNFARSMAGIGTGIAAAMGLAYLAWKYLHRDKDKEPFLVTDPRSADFMKPRFNNTRLDLMAGLSQPMVMMSRLLTGERINAKGEVRPIRQGMRPLNLFRDKPHNDAPKYGEASGFDVMTNFARSKLAPVFGSAVNLSTGKDFKGDPVSLDSEVLNNTMPMSITGMAAAIEDAGVPVGVAWNIASILGSGLQTYDEHAKRDVKPPPFYFHAWPEPKSGQNPPYRLPPITATVPAPPKRLPFAESQARAMK